MQSILRRRDLCQFVMRSGGLVGVILAASCSGGSYVSSSGTPAVVPTNVVGKSDTSGISAGAALQAPNATSTAKP
jgi:hypothetical protein